MGPERERRDEVRSCQNFHVTSLSGPEAQEFTGTSAEHSPYWGKNVSL